MNTEMRNEIISTIFGLVGIILGIITQVPFYVVAIMGIGLYIGTKFLLPVQETEKLLRRRPMVPELKPNSDIDNIQKVVTEINACSVMIDDISVLTKVQNIVQSALSAVDMIQKDTDQEHILDVYKILQYLLTLVKKYITLSGHSSELHEFNRAKETFFGLLDNMNQYLSQYQVEGLKSDILDFDYDMQLIDSKIRKNLS